MEAGSSKACAAQGFWKISLPGAWLNLISCHLYLFGRLAVGKRPHVDRHQLGVRLAGQLGQHERLVGIEDNVAGVPGGLPVVDDTVPGVDRPAVEGFPRRFEAAGVPDPLIVAWRG